MIRELGKGKARLIVSVGSGANRRRYTKTVEYQKKKELRQLYSDFEVECQKRPQTDISVEQLLGLYIDYMRVLGRKQTTIHGYEIVAERLQSLTDGILARNLTTARLEKIIVEMSQNGLGAKTIKNTIGLLSAAYRYAIKIDLLEENPCEKVTRPKGQPREIRILYINEIPAFLNAIADVDLNEKVAYELALFLGLRRSEILGLKESDIDVVRGLVNIHNTRHRIDGEDYDSDTKTKRSTRVLAVPDFLLLDIVKLLQIHKDFPYEKCDYLVQDGFGEPLGGQALASRLSRLEVNKGLPHVTLHGLRHTYASLLHARGVDMANISAELGHSNLSTTQNVYTHIFSDATNASRGIASVIDEFAKILSQNDAQNDTEAQDVVAVVSETATSLPQLENKKR